MIRILAVDDHPQVRQRVRQLLADEPDMAVQGEAGDAREALELVRMKDWAVVLLDISLPDRSGLELLADIRRERPELPVLVLSIHPEEQFGPRARRAGAAAYVTKERAPTDLVPAIRRILASGRD